MKNILFFTLLVLSLGSCKDKIIHQYLANKPIYTDWATFRQSISFESARPIENQAGLFIKGQYLFIVEQNKGIHFIDNINPSSPIKLGFLAISGCSGMSIKDNYLYVNHRIDLVVIDISNITAPVVVDRLENQFIDELPEGNSDYPYAVIDGSLGIVTGWEIAEVKENVSSSPTIYNCDFCEISMTSTDQGGLIASNNTLAGSGQHTQSGSITKFAIINDFLYIVSHNYLLPIDVSNPLDIQSHESSRMSRNVETLFPHNGHLFMGTTTGMLIFSTSSPASPEQISFVDHMRACDPVVVQGNKAYVTVRSGNLCGGNLNQLDVIDISDLYSPSIIATYPMENPHGLGIENNTLFICDGSAGLKVFDSSDPQQIDNNLLHTFSDIQAIDIIPHNNIGIVMTTDGIHQYDYSNLNSIQYLSKIQ